MKPIYLATASVGLGLSLAACDYNRNEAAYNNDSAAYAENAADYPEGATGANYATSAGAWPQGTRIVVEDGVTYRIGPDGVRVALGPNDSRIVIEEGVRYRVDPDGTRVRIDEQGVVIDVDSGGVSATVNTQ